MLFIISYSAAAAIIAATAVIAIAAAATVIAVAAPAAACEENDKNKDYPEAAIAVTIIEAHIYYLSPRYKSFFAAVKSCAV